MKKKKVLLGLFLLVGVLILLGGVSIIFIMENQKTSYRSLESVGKKDYDVNLVFSNEDIFTFYGSYHSKEKTLTIIDDEEKEQTLNQNLYLDFLKYLKEDYYNEEDKVTTMISGNELKEMLPFWENISSDSYECSYELVDKMILSIDCFCDKNRIALDFDA